MDYSRKVAVLVVIDLDEDVSRLYAICHLQGEKVERRGCQGIVVLSFLLEFKVVLKYLSFSTGSYDHEVCC